MSLFRRKPKRLPPHEWSLSLIASRIVSAYVSDPEGADVRASVIFHLDPELVPEDMDERARREAEDDGSEYTGIVDWHVLALEFVEDEEGADRVALYMDHDPTALIRQRRGFETLDDARAEAQEWVGGSPEAVAFRSIPGVFQSAVITAIGCRDLEPHPADLMWAPDFESDAEWVAVRKFPPPVNERNEGQWNLLPPDAVEDLLADRGW